MGVRPILRTMTMLLIGTISLILSIRRVETIRLSCIADTNLSSYEGEAMFNYGASPRIRLKGIQMFGLFRFDTQAIRGMKIERAELRLRYAGADRALKTLGFSTLSIPWNEGTGRGERIDGEACFNAAQLGSRAWSSSGPDMTAVIFAPPGRWGYRDAEAVENGWLRADIPIEILRAHAAGAATGIVVTDEKGQTAANNDVYAREQHGSEPYILVRAARHTAARVRPPTDIRITQDIGSATVKRAAIRISFVPDPNAVAVAGELQVQGEPKPRTLPIQIIQNGPANRRYVDLSDLPPRHRVVAQLWSISEEGMKVVGGRVAGQTGSALFQPPSIRAATLPTRADAPLERRYGAYRIVAYPFGYRGMADAGRPFEPLRWRADRLELMAAKREPVRAMLELLPIRTRTRDRVALHFTQPTRIYEIRSVGSGSGAMPDICEPIVSGRYLSERGQADGRHMLLVEIRAAAAPLRQRHTISLRSEDGRHTQIVFDVRQSPFALPRQPGFELSLNTYGSPARAAGLDPAAPDGRAMELAYHRVAQLHRATLTPLGYSHSGNMEPGYAPLTEGSGRTRHVIGWSEWDARFGPLIDGTAFTYEPRSRQPISHMYLPFHEEWPESIRADYRYRPASLAYPSVIYDHALLAGPIEQMLPDRYRDGLEAVLEDFARHIRSRGWDTTTFQFYLNNKYDYRDPAKGGRGTSWWLLDEPMHRDDWLALAWYAKRVRRVQSRYPRSRIVFRADISRPQWQRDYLDGLIDVMVVNDELYRYSGLMRRYTRSGVRLWHYGTPPSIEESLSVSEGWPVRAYLAGADGIVPWQSVGTNNSYREPDATALILPPLIHGIGEPIASLRLKALESGQSTVEHLRALGYARRWTREQVALAVQPWLIRQDYAGMRSAIRFALQGSSGSARIQVRHSRGQDPVGRPRAPRPKP